MHNEIQDVLGQSFAVPDGLDEDDLLEELDALEDEMANELETGSRAGVPSYLQVRSPLCSRVLDIRHSILLTLHLKGTCISAISLCIDCYGAVSAE